MRLSVQEPTRCFPPMCFLAIFKESYLDGTVLLWKISNFYSLKNVLSSKKTKQNPVWKNCQAGWKSSAFGKPWWPWSNSFLKSSSEGCWPHSFQWEIMTLLRKHISVNILRNIDIYKYSEIFCPNQKVDQSWTLQNGQGFDVSLMTIKTFAAIPCLLAFSSWFCSTSSEKPICGLLSKWKLALYSAALGREPTSGFSLGALHLCLHEETLLPPTSNAPGLSPSAAAWPVSVFRSFSSQCCGLDGA